MYDTDDTTPAAGDGRDRKRRFRRGNPGGPGRPPKASEVNFLLAVADVVDVGRRRRIVERIAAFAESGDLKAATWIGRFLLGTDPGRLSEAVAGVLRDGPHYRVAEQLERKEELNEPDGFEGILEPEVADRRERVRKMVAELADPDDGG